MTKEQIESMMKEKSIIIPLFTVICFSGIPVGITCMIWHEVNFGLKVIGTALTASVVMAVVSIAREKAISELADEYLKEYTEGYAKHRATKSKFRIRLEAMAKQKGYKLPNQSDTDNT